MAILDCGGNAVAVLMGALRDYSDGKDVELNYQVIESLVTEAKKINGDPKIGGHELAVQSRAILMVWQDASKDMRLTCLDTGKTEEQLKRDAAEAERKRKQGEEWARQGLCRNCGGQLGMFGKCKACGRRS